MLGNEKCEVRILGAQICALIAVSVNRYDSVCIFINDDSVWVHTESTYIVLKFFGAVYDLTLIEFIGQMREDDGRKLNTHSDIHTVGLCRNIKIVTDGLHPLASASTYGDHTFLTVVRFVLRINTVSVFKDFDFFDWCIEEEIHVILHLIVQILQNNIIDICSKVTDRSIQKLQFILQTDLLQIGSGSRVHLSAFTTVGHIDMIHIFHEVKRLLASDIFI